MKFNFREEDKEKNNNREEGDNKEMGLLLSEIKEQRVLMSQIVGNQETTLQRMQQNEDETKEIKQKVIELVDWKEKEARIHPKDCGKIAKNVKSAVVTFLDSYGLDYNAWRGRAFAAHNTYIIDECGVSCRADILLSDTKKAFKLSSEVNENYWKVQALLTEAAINNGMPIQWEGAQQNDFWEVVKYHLRIKDLENIIETNPNQIYEEVAKRQLLRENKKRK